MTHWIKATRRDKNFSLMLQAMNSALCIHTQEIDTYDMKSLHRLPEVSMERKSFSEKEGQKHTCMEGHFWSCLCPRAYPFSLWLIILQMMEDCKNHKGWIQLRVLGCPRKNCRRDKGSTLLRRTIDTVETVPCILWVLFPEFAWQGFLGFRGQLERFLAM